MAISVLKRLRLVSRKALRPDVKRAGQRPSAGARVDKVSSRLSHIMFAGLALVAATPSVRGDFEVLHESAPRRITLHAEPLAGLPRQVAEAPDRAEVVALAAPGGQATSKPGATIRASEIEQLRSRKSLKALKRLIARKLPRPSGPPIAPEPAPGIMLASLSDAVPVALEEPPHRLLRVRRRGRDRPAEAIVKPTDAPRVAALSEAAPPPLADRPIESVMKGARYTVVPSWSERDIADAKRVCATVLTSRKVVASEVAPVREGSCGAPAPINVRKIGEPGVDIEPAAMLTCPMAAALDRWITEVVQPAALETFGAPVVRLVSMSSYSCRNRYGRAQAPISEHALINAVDLAGFVLRDGRTVKVLGGWGRVARDAPAAPSRDHPGAVKVAEAKTGKTSDGVSMLGAGSLAKEAAAASKTAGNSDKASPKKPEKGSEEQAPAKTSGEKPAPDSKPAVAKRPEPSEEEKRSTFLHKVHADACSLFGTVLGPEANDAHRNHFHLDMKARRGKHGYCQ